MLFHADGRYFNEICKKCCFIHDSHHSTLFIFYENSFERILRGTLCRNHLNVQQFIATHCSCHFETTVRIRINLWKKEYLFMKKMTKKDSTRDVKSEILQKIKRDCLHRNVHNRMPVSLKKHSSSGKSIEARKSSKEYEAAKLKAGIERKAVERTRS